MANDVDARAHQDWIGFVQPVGLVVTAPALVAAQAYVNRGSLMSEQEWFRAFVGEARVIESVPRLLKEFLKWEDSDVAEPGDRFDVVLPEYHETLRPSWAAPLAGGSHLLVQALPAKTGFDLLPDEGQGWHASPQTRFERLLRDTNNPVGLLCNGEAVRVVYSPRGESAGHVTFPVAAMCETAGRPILGALMMLLHADRVFTLPEDQRLPAILRDSRRYQSEVSTKLAEQVLAALHELLRGFQAADAAVQGRLLQELRRAENRQDLYGGLLTTILRLVFVLYAEDRGLMPQTEVYLRHYAVTALFDELRDDEARYPDVMDQRFGAWARLVTLFRLVFRGGSHGGFALPKRHGELFDPDLYPFLEGRHPGEAFSSDRADKLRSIPRMSDGVVLRVLKYLLVLDGERLSYRALDVEQIGSVYESMMGFELEEALGPSIALRPKHVVVNLGELVSQTGKQRAETLKEADSEVAGNTLKAVQAAKTVEELVSALDRRVSPTTPAVLALGALYLQPGEERRRSGSHYTPRSLTEPIVRKTLQPVLDGLGPNPTSDQILSLKVCDPAMGSGAFLVEACRYLGDALKEAWNRHRQTPKVPPDEDVVLRARRLVAQRCLYGVDKNPFAVSLAKLSLWLFTLAKDHPFTFLDHALKCGDSLVGLTKNQIARFTWEDGETAWTTTFTSHVAKLVRTAEDLRIQIHAIGDPPDTTELEALHQRAEEALGVARGIGDLVVACFFAEKKEKARKALLGKLGAQVHLLASRGAPEDQDDSAGSWAFQIRELVGSLRYDHAGIPARPFHWELEFPEVFGEGRDGFDCFVGNPPFAGKNSISASGGEAYIPWLQTLHSGAHGNADLSAHFFRRAFALLCTHGTFGLIATNTIAQGDTRATALKPIVAEGGVIYDATRSMMWPGMAAVAVSVVHAAKGRDRDRVKMTLSLDGKKVQQINSRLRGKPERPDPVTLKSNENLSFQGSIVLGMGFVLTPEERDALVKKNPRNADRIYPYIGGEEVNTSPTQEFRRYVICFSVIPRRQGEKFRSLSEGEAKKWPILYERVEELVKPERMALGDNADAKKRKQNWWLFGRDTPALYDTIAGLDRVIVTARVSKHLLWSFQPSGRITSEQTIVLALRSHGAIAVLQSRAHEPWARFLSSSMKQDVRYAPSDCFENFPFPHQDPRTAIPALEFIGQRLYDARAAYTVSRNQGLTTTYNELKDPGCCDPDVEALRALHLDLDRAVLDAYGWADVVVPPYTTPQTDEERAALERFEDDVLDRLFTLNAKRAAEEASGLPAPTGAKKSRGPKKSAQCSLDLLTTESEAPPKKPRRRA